MVKITMVKVIGKKEKLMMTLEENDEMWDILGKYDENGWTLLKKEKIEEDGNEAHH